MIAFVLFLDETIAEDGTNGAEMHPHFSKYTKLVKPNKLE